MTIEELKELNDRVQTHAHRDLTILVGGLRPKDYGKLIELIDEKISQLSVTDEDVQRAIQTMLSKQDIVKITELDYESWGNQPEGVTECQKEIEDFDLAITALQQMNTEPCEYCNGEMEQFFEIIDANFCMRCGRKLR